MKLQFSLRRNYLLISLIGFLCLASLVQTAGAQIQNPRFRLAQNLLKHYEYKDALDIFQELYRTDPGNVLVIKGIQECYRELQEFDKLIDLLTGVTGRFPTNMDWQIDLAEAYYLNDEHINANQIWYGIIDRQPKNIAAYRRIAGSMINQRLFDQAIDVYTRAQQNISGQQNLHIDIANLYKLELAYGKASDHLLEFYKHNPKQLSFVQNQILTLTDQPDKVPEIIEAVENFSRRYPDQKGVTELKAGIYVKLGKYDLALQSYRALEDEKSGGAFLLNFALSARNNGAYGEALEAYQVILGLNTIKPNPSQICYDMAYCYKKMASPENPAYLSRAVSIYDSLAGARTQGPVKLASLENLGDIYYQSYFDLDRAQSYYNEFLKLTPANKNRDRVLLKLGDVYRAKNDLGMAQKTYSQATRQEERSISIFKQAELVYFRGQFGQAETNFEKLLQRIGPNHALTNDILTYLADIREHKNDSLALAAFADAQLLEIREKKSESAEIFSRLVYDKTPLKYRALTCGVQNLLDLDRNEEASRILTFYQDNWPDDVNIDAIYYLHGVTAEQMHEPQTALQFYQSILINYPNSLYLEEARTRARRLDQLLKKEQS